MSLPLSSPLASLPVEIFYTVIANVVSSYVDEAITSPSSSASAGPLSAVKLDATQSTAEQPALNDSSICIEFTSVINESGAVLPGIRKQLEERKANEEQESLPKNTVLPLLLVNCAFYRTSILALCDAFAPSADMADNYAFSPNNEISWRTLNCESILKTIRFCYRSSMDINSWINIRPSDACFPSPLLKAYRWLMLGHVPLAQIRPLVAAMPESQIEDGNVVPGLLEELVEQLRDYVNHVHSGPLRERIGMRTEMLLWRLGYASTVASTSIRIERCADLIRELPAVPQGEDMAKHHIETIKTLLQTHLDFDSKSPLSVPLPGYVAKKMDVDTFLEPLPTLVKGRVALEDERRVVELCEKVKESWVRKFEARDVDYLGAY